MKKKATIDMLGDAQIPADLLTPTEGSNWGIGGYPDVEYGAGALEAFFPGDTSGLPGSDTATAGDASFFMDDDGPDLVSLESSPDAAWFANEADDMPGLDFSDTEIMKEGSLSDLSWLELHEQDEDRLPQNPVNLGIPELEEAWGANRRTDGFNLHSHNKDLNEVRYRQAVESPTKPNYRFSASDLMHVVQRAMRRSAVGHPLNEILREAAETLGDEAYRAKQAMQILQEEHGLLGKVFIRASAYPGYEQGKWTEQLRKMGSARYIVVDKRTLTGSVTVQDGRCTVTKKRAVLEVPWGEALQFYRPALERLGRKVASGDPKAALRAALNESPKVERQATAFPRHVTPSERISAADAKRQLAATEASAPKVVDPKVAHEQSNRQKAARRIESWVRAGMLAATEARTILASNESGEKMLRQAATRILRTKGASAFSGTTNEAARPRVASEQEARTTLAAIKPPTPINKMASVMVTYAKRAMSEGTVGRALDDLLSVRFAASVREAARDALAAVRRDHEGGSGFVYVDASAYASDAGVTGCERGALRHRANQLKFVMAMDRCASCTLAASRADGSRVCRQYNKTLVTAADLPDEMSTIRRMNIRSASLPDQEATASYFAPTYDPHEYDLRNASFEDVAIDAAPEHEVMGDIFFGGMEF